MTAVQLSGVIKRYGTHTAVGGVDLSLGVGERLALLGHNGAGKTTLMKLVLGLVPASAGGVTVLGGPPGRPDAKAATGFLPENVAFHEAMTGWETLRFYARLKRRPAEECRSLLDRVGLEGAAKRRVGTYSKGMRQRLGLAQALLGEPRLLLLDEPTTGLDPELRHAFYEIVRELKDRGAAILLSSHLLTELEERTDRLAILDHGRLVVAGTLDELRAAAGLPLRFRVRVAAGCNGELAERLGNAAWREDADTYLLACRAPDKMALLRRLAALEGLVTDIDIQPPGLSDVYAHFVGGAVE